MKRALVAVALLVAAVATWIALRGDVPSADTPASAVDRGRPSSRLRTRAVEPTADDATTVDEEAPTPDASESPASPEATADAPPAVDPEAGMPIAVGRLVDGSGAPISGFTLVAHVVDVGGDSTPMAESTTAADGRFRFVLSRPKGAATSPRLEVGRRIARVLRYGDDKRIAFVDLPATLPVGEFSVGDVVFRGNALLVAGVVVDSAGKPIPGVALRAVSDRRTGFTDDAALTDGAGRFRLSGEPTTDSVSVGASIDWYYLAERPTFAVGTTDARIVMERAGGISGSVLVSKERPNREWMPTLAWITVSGPPADNGDSEIRPRETLMSHTSEDGKFGIYNLRPGVARVSVRVDNVGRVTVDDVRVVAGEITRDPRLKDVDPWKATSSVTVTTTNATGWGLPAHVWFRPYGKDEWWTDAGEGERVKLRADAATIAGGLDVLVKCGEYRSRLVSDVRADTTVALERVESTTVTVRLAANAPLPSPPFELAAKLRWSDADADRRSTPWDPRDSRASRDRFGKDRVVAFPAVEPGRYRVELVLWEMEMHGGSSAGRVATDPKSVIVPVGDGGASVEVVVGVDAEELRDSMRRRQSR